MNRLLNTCVKNKQFHRALKVFDEMPQRNTISYNIIICGIMNHSFTCFKLMLLSNHINHIYPDEITFNGLLRSCINLHTTGVFTGQQTHSFVTKLGYVSNSFVVSSLVDMYSKFKLLQDARLAFDDIVLKDLVLWNVMISSYVSNRLIHEALDLYSKMRFNEVSSDAFTLCSLLSCGYVGTCEFTMQLHCIVVKVSYLTDLMVATALVNMYVKNGGIVDGRRAFDEIKVRSLVTWNTMIVGYGRGGDVVEAMKLLRDMFKENVVADEVTFASIFSTCGRSSSALEIAQIRVYTIKHGFELFPSIINSIVNAYSKCGDLFEASLCFELSWKRDLITWTSMINGYWTNGRSEKAIIMFEKMLCDGVKPDDIVFLSILSACNHAGLIDEGFHYINLMSSCYDMKPNEDHYTCLIDLLSRYGEVDEGLVLLLFKHAYMNEDSLNAFIKACVVYGRIDLVEFAVEKLRRMELNVLESRRLCSSVYALNKDWLRAAEIRQGVRRISGRYKTAGCSKIVV